MLVVPVPRPVSLNEVVSAPVLVWVLVLLSANRKWGLSASADVAVSMIPASTEMSRNTRRFITLIPSLDGSCDSGSPRSSPLSGRAAGLGQLGAAASGR